jgi:predicted dipeptidase
MRISLEKLLPLALLLSCCYSWVAISAQTLSSVDSEVLLERIAPEGIDSFNAFLVKAVVLEPAPNVQFTQVASRYLDKQVLSAQESQVLNRLLGIYTRIRYEDLAVEMLARFVAIPTFSVAGLPQHENPEFHRFAQTLASVSEEFGLRFRNVEERVYEISMGDHGGELIGIHAHADVVPVNPSLWQLPDGSPLEPFTLTFYGDQMFGRGAEDDKNGIVVSMLAMKVAQDEGLPLIRDFKLLIDTTEETQGTAMPYYFERNRVPDFNIALDGNYPVVIAEKGYGTVMASFPVRQALGEGAEIVDLSGGLATNQIPATSTALLLSADAGELIVRLNQLGSQFASLRGSNFRVQASQEDSRVRLDVFGMSAHSSDPASGINPVSRMMELIVYLDEAGELKRNHFTDAARYASENWGLDYLGNTLGLAYEDAFMGPLTTAQTFVDTNENSLRTAVNLRLPIGREPQDLLDEIDAKISAWIASNDVTMRIDLSAGAPMYRNPEGAWVNALLDIATENLGIERKFGSSAGGTSIHDLPNGVQFGLAMPHEKYTGHNANEFKRRSQFLVDLQIVTEMIARLGTMESL